MNSSRSNDISELIIRQYLSELNSNPPPDNNRKIELVGLIEREREREERELKNQRDHSEKIWKMVLKHIFGNNNTKNVKIKIHYFISIIINLKAHLIYFPRKVRKVQSGSPESPDQSTYSQQYTILGIPLNGIKSSSPSHWSSFSNSSSTALPIETEMKKIV